MPLFRAGNLLFNATSIAWPLLWGLILLKVWDMERLARWQKAGVTLVAKIKPRKFPAVEIRRMSYPSNKVSRGG